MFNLLIKHNAWENGTDTLGAERLLEYTAKDLVAEFTIGGKVQLDRLIKMPTLFMQELQNGPDAFARVGTITNAKLTGKDVLLEYSYDLSIPAIPNKSIEALAIQFGIDDRSFEFSRTHWAVKDVDLYKVLIRNSQPHRQRPSVFKISDHESIEPLLASAMMPFNAGFNTVYASLKSSTEKVGLRCRRADDIWENPAVIQDVVSLIDRSRVVICDCTDRNPNVFYEIGIAHTLGREVILITQNESDIPFDLRHLRFIKYLNNAEGRKALRKDIETRLNTLLS